MTKHHGQAPSRCAGPHCEQPLPGPARTGRPGLYCGQACRQAALRQRHLDGQAPRLREEARELLEEIGPGTAAAARERLEAMDGEQLARAVRHARAAADHLTALLGLPPGRALPGPGPADRPAPAPGPRPPVRGPRPAPG
ncbi:hypothetical protein [Kitasatospora sp. NPDC094011]|uniref:hypothetical protein n=1 Tax=Kitasatospora sp. NPDC094011 TaxID=3364090 RepID=UPI0038290E58